MKGNVAPFHGPGHKITSNEHNSLETQPGKGKRTSREGVLFYYYVGKRTTSKSVVGANDFSVMSRRQMSGEEGTWLN